MEEPPPDPLPWPRSLCHRCGAPPRYVRTGRSVFVLCPLLPRKYPPQPVLSCVQFRPRREEDGPGEPAVTRPPRPHGG